MKKVIYFSGHAKHGKDTAAEMAVTELTARGERVRVVHYADLLKFICTQYFDWNGQKDDAGRSLLQFVGTDVVREQDPEFWVRFVQNLLTMFKDCWDYVIIPDCRFPNEIEHLKQSGFDCVHARVIRPDFDNGLSEEQKNHPSETALDHYPDVDFRLINTTMENLRSLVKQMCQII